MRNKKYTYEEKIKTCEDYLSGNCSASQIAHDYGLKKFLGSMWRWINVYREHGLRHCCLKKGMQLILKNVKYRLLKNI